MMSTVKYVTVVLTALSLQSINGFSDQLEPPPKFSGKDITGKLFGAKNNHEVFPLAFGDINADKLTDVFATDKERSTFYVYAQHEEEVLLRQMAKCELRGTSNGVEVPVNIVGIAPGDFNGDGVLDVAVTYNVPISDTDSVTQRQRYNTVVFSGALEKISCEVQMKPITRLTQEPLMIDINGDMIMDFLGEYEDKNNKTRKAVWVFEAEDLKYTRYDIIVEESLDVKKHYSHKNSKWIKPSSLSYVDVNGDGVPELVAISEVNEGGCTRHFVEEYGLERSEFNGTYWQLNLNRVTPLDRCEALLNIVGQSIFMDFMQNGQLTQLVPACTEKDACHNPKILAIQRVADQTYNVTEILLDSKDEAMKKWGFVVLHGTSWKNDYYNSEGGIVLRVGDYNMDGYPDLIGTMMEAEKTWNKKEYRAVIFENVPCDNTTGSCDLERKFQLDFQSLEQYGNVTMATFFDIYDDGLLDVMLVRRTDAGIAGRTDDGYSVFGYQSNPDYDANYLKVVVTTGRQCKTCPMPGTPYGNVIPGPVVRYRTETQTEEPVVSVAAQCYRSAHRTLDLPYVYFGIGHSPNFIESLEVQEGNSGEARQHQWTQLIPNSQIIVIPESEQSEWKAKIFLPSNAAAVHTFIVLLGFCLIIVLIVIGFYWRERIADRKERLLESQRFIM